MSDIRNIWLYAHSMIRNARQIINENLRPLNLSSAEGNILLHLWTQGHEIGQDRLVEQLDISKPAVSRALSALERKGYVTRRPDPQDGRARQITLTDSAREIGPRIEKIYNEMYAMATKDISRQELETFFKLFRRMAENFDREQLSKSANEEAR